jgi:hypothetical protein
MKNLKIASLLPHLAHDDASILPLSISILHTPYGTSCIMHIYLSPPSPPPPLPPTFPRLPPPPCSTLTFRTLHLLPVYITLHKGTQPTVRLFYFILFLFLFFGRVAVAF